MPRDSQPCKGIFDGFSSAEGILFGPYQEPADQVVRIRTRAVVGCLKIAQGFQRGGNEEAVIVTILCDSGDKYLSERFWTES